MTVLRTTAEAVQLGWAGGAFRALDWWAETAGTAAAVNFQYFARDTQQAIGLVVQGAQQRYPATTKNLACLVKRTDGSLTWLAEQDVLERLGEVDWAVAAGPMLVTGGHSTGPDGWAHRSGLRAEDETARVALAVKGDDVYLLVQEQATLADMQRLALSYGAEWAIAGDGGGSAQLWHDGQVLVSSDRELPSVLRLESAERVDGSQPPQQYQEGENSVKLVIDPGHGGQDSGATGHGLREKDLTLEIARHLRDQLQGYDVDVLMTRDRDTTVSLNERTNMANRWGADFFLSVHVNAGGGTGYEDFTYEGLPDDSETVQLQQAIHDHMAGYYGSYGFPDRGAKQDNFHVLRESTMPAVLVENLFIDHAEDAAYLSQSDSPAAIGYALSQSLADALGLELTEEPAADADWQAKHKALLTDLQSLVDKHSDSGS